LAVVLAVLAGGLWAGWAYTQSRYYVGLTDSNVVAIYQGVPGKIVGLRLSNVYSMTDLTYNDLVPADQALVKQTIPVASLTAAQDAVDKLRSDKLIGPTPPASCPPSVNPTPTTAAPTHTGVTTLPTTPTTPQPSPSSSC